MDPQTCPWSSFEPAAIEFCERSVCGWITQPANTWSNVAYILVGLWIAYLAVRDQRPTLAIIGVLEIALGFGSGLFHASGTHFGEVIDVGCMFLFSVYVLVVNTTRWQAHRGVTIPGSIQVAAFLVLSASSIAVVALYRGVAGIVLFAVQAYIGGSIEFHLYRHYRGALTYAPLAWLLGTFLVAWSVWWLDLLRIACQPDNHWLQGHALWHVLNSFCFLFLYRFYRQLPLFTTPDPSRP